MEKLYSTLKEISESNLIDYQNENYEDKYLSIESRSLNFSKDIKAVSYTHLTLPTKVYV